MYVSYIIYVHSVIVFYNSAVMTLNNLYVEIISRGSKFITYTTLKYFKNIQVILLLVK